MRKDFSAADHDPGDEDPTERVKRALLDVLDDGNRPPSFVSVAWPWWLNVPSSETR